MRADYLEPQDLLPFNHPEENDWVHVSTLPDLDQARRHMKKILDVLYKGASIESLEPELEELCSYLDMDIPSTPLKVFKE